MKALNILIYLLLAAPVFGFEPAELNSAPVDWGRVSLERGRLSLSGVFSVSIPEPLCWKLAGSGTGPTGSPYHVWSANSLDGNRQILLLVVDVDARKVPAAERPAFMNSFVRAFRRTGIAAMEKKGFRTARFEVGPYPAGGSDAVTAISDVEKNGSHIYNFTYAFPASRFYMIGYEGKEAEVPQWFLEILGGFTKS